MVLLIGNYPLDRQHSMQRFGDLMLGGLRVAGVETEFIAPRPFFGRAIRDGLLGKWLGYIDKYIIFPTQLHRKLRKNPTVVHVCDHSNALYIPHQHRHSRFVVTCHDLLAVRGALGEETDCPASLTGRLLQRWIVRGLRRANALACVSHSTMEDVRRLIRPNDPAAVEEVIPLALNFDYRPIPVAEARAVIANRVPVLANGEAYALHVGSNLRRKNRDGLLRIFALTKEQWNGRFVFAGEMLDPNLSRLAAELGISDRIVQIGNPDPELLRALYNCATALVFPSRFEGFGWPIIEAQACGCPVVCSRTGPLPEAAAEAGLFREVEDEAGFAADLMRLANPSERAIWSKKSLRRVERLSAEGMIREYLALYRKIGATV